MTDTHWGDAYRKLSKLDRESPLGPDDLDRFATAAYLTGRDEESFDIWSRAHLESLADGAIDRAAHYGIQVAQGLAFKGEIARSRGWVDRTRRMLDDADLDCVEVGYLDHSTALCRIYESGDVVSARELFAKAAELGNRFDDRELVALGQIGEGRCLVYLGEQARGLALLDEAMVAVENREMSPLAIGDCYCTVIDACNELFDVARGKSWTASFSRWCDTQPDLVLYRGHCLLHRAEILQLQGAWGEALTEAQQACSRLAEPVNLTTLGGAHYVEAELHRLRGDFAAAEESYRSANELGCEPQPGLALMRLAQGRSDAAEASVRRILAEAEGPMDRARVLAAAVEILLAAGDTEAARGAAEELAEVAEVLESTLLKAQAAHATGSVLVAADAAGEALSSLRAAQREWSALGATYDGARTRVLIAAACQTLGDDDGEQMELEAARTAFEKLGATPELGKLPGPDRNAPGGLTPREIEVLVLLANGKTNRAIAAELIISEKTVASHVSHIFTKLDLSSRSAATGYAYEQGLM